VLLPIFVAMFLISVARHYGTKLMQADAKVDIKALREAQAVIRSGRLRGGANFLPASALDSRRKYFCAKEARIAPLLSAAAAAAGGGGGRRRRAQLLRSLLRPPLRHRALPRFGCCSPFLLVLACSASLL